MSNVPIQLRRNGTPKAYWYDEDDGHVFHRRPDGSLECFSFHCHHPEVVVK